MPLDANQSFLRDFEYRLSFLSEALSSTGCRSLETDSVSLARGRRHMCAKPVRMQVPWDRLLLSYICEGLRVVLFDIFEVTLELSDQFTHR